MLLDRICLVAIYPSSGDGELPSNCDTSRGSIVSLKFLAAFTIDRHLISVSELKA